MLGKLYYFDKNTKVRTLFGSVDKKFSFEENINETPSNVKINLVNSVRNDLEVNTICWHDETNTWWVVKADNTTYLPTSEYKHELDLVEAFEYLNYTHLPNHAYRPNKYTFTTFLNRLLKIAKFPFTTTYVSSISTSDKTMPRFAFEGFTLSSAIKTFARSLNLIPKLTFTTTTSGGDTLLNQAVLTFINRFGKDMIPLTTFNGAFPVQFERKSNSSDRFATRVVVNMKNALSTELVNAYGVRAFTKNEPQLKDTDLRIYLNSKIDRVASITPLSYASIDYWQLTAGAYNKIKTFWNGYYLNSESKTSILSNMLAFGSYRHFTTDQIRTIVFPDENLAEIRLNDTLGSYETNKPYRGFLTLKTQPEYATTASTSDREKTFTWEQGEDSILVPAKFKDALTSQSEWNKNVILLEATVGTEKDFIVLNLVSETTINPISTIDLPFETLFFKVSYYPVGDIKATYDNENDSTDERFMNQTGKMIDAFSGSQQAYANVNDSASSSVIRSARYTSYGDILDIGTLVRDTDGFIYVINQRSIEIHHEYYSVIYNLSKGRITRSENINADSSIIDYQIPEQNTVVRNQLYKDYVEFSVDGAIAGRPTPYLSLANAFDISKNSVGALFGDYNYYGKGTTAGSVNFYYNLQPVAYDLAYSKILSVDYKDNNYIGYSLTKNAGNYDQLVKVYTDANGELASIRSVFSLTKPFAQYTTLPLVSSTFYNNLSGIVIDETQYDKDQYEVPAFTYQLQVNGTYGTKGNVLLANDLLKTFAPPTEEKNFVEYRYVVSNSRFTTDNALALYSISGQENLNQIARIVRNDNVTITHTLHATSTHTWVESFPAEYELECFPRYSMGTYATLSAFLSALSSTYPPSGQPQYAGVKAFITALGYTVYYKISFVGTNNTTSLLNKNIGIFAIYYNETFGYANRRKFLYAINDYNDTSNSSIVVKLNNYKI